MTAAKEVVVNKSGGVPRLHVDKRADKLLNEIATLGDDTLHSTVETAELLGCSRQFLEIARWRGEGHGPRYIRISPRRIRYRISDIKAWLETRAFTHTAEYMGKSKKK